MNDADRIITAIDNQNEVLGEYIDGTTSAVENIGYTIEQIEVMQHEIISGEKLIEQRLEQTNNSVILVAMIGAMFIIYNFVVRGLK